MSITRIVSIHCDGCGVWAYSNSAHSEGTARSIRAELRLRGWLVAQSGSRDYCTECRAAADRLAVQTSQENQP